MRIKKATKNNVALLIYEQNGNRLLAWQYPSQVHFEINGVPLSMRRSSFDKLVKFLRKK